MKRVPLFVALVVGAVAGRADPGSAPAKGASGGPPPMPPYQMRAAMPAGNRLTDDKGGAALFSNRCGACHLVGGMGTNLLTKERVSMGDAPASGLLTNRTDLTVTYIKAVARHGKLAMPRLTRVDVTDAELDAIAHYLGKAGE